jgi:hypothetical protein
MPKTFVSPVILKILSIRSCVHTRSREPSCARELQAADQHPEPGGVEELDLSMLMTSREPPDRHREDVVWPRQPLKMNLRLTAFNTIEDDEPGHLQFSGPAV